MNRRVRVLFLIDSLDRGGTEGQLVALATGLDRSQFDPMVCCLAGGGLHEEALRNAGIPVTCVGFSGVRIAHPLDTLERIARLRRIVRGAAPDIVHAQLFWSCVLGAYVARLAGVRRVIAGRRSLTHYRRALPKLALWLDRGAARLTDIVVANSEAVRDDVARTEGLPREKLRVIYNGVDASGRPAHDRAGARTALGIPPRARVVVVVANLIAYKGHGDLLRAWPSVRARMPDAMALFVGDGPCAEQLKEQAAALGLLHSVLLLGGSAPVGLCLAAADLFVLPSLQEGLSNAVLEAMARGLPVVATDVGGNAELVLAGRTGLLVPPRDPAALARGILEVFSDTDRAAAWGEHGRRRVQESFRLETMVDRYQALYRELLSHGRGHAVLRPEVPRSRSRVN